jgi:hypothetical protein
VCRTDSSRAAHAGISSHSSNFKGQFFYFVICCGLLDPSRKRNFICCLQREQQHEGDMSLLHTFFVCRREPGVGTTFGIRLRPCCCFPSCQRRTALARNHDVCMSSSLPTAFQGCCCCLHRATTRLRRLRRKPRRGTKSRVGMYVDRSPQCREHMPAGGGGGGAARRGFFAAGSGNSRL